MGWIANLLRRPDVGLRPGNGAQVDLEPLSERGGRWLKYNLFRFPGAVWSGKRGCVELGRGRRDRTASRGRAVERGRDSSEVLRAASALGRHVTGLDVAGTREAMIRRLSQRHRHRARCGRPRSWAFSA